jgi:ferrous-iron efflux pump FieF
MSQAADPGGEARAGTASTRPTHSAEAARLMRLATYASVATAMVLIGVKLVAWLYTDSVSLLSTLIDSVLDALASIINLLAVRHALMPADREHRFGHGKAEPLAALGQATFISGSALFLVFEASHRLFTPAPIAHTGFGIGVMAFAIAVTFVLTRFQAYVVRKTGSIAIKADSLHYFGDLLVNLYCAWRIARGAYDMLMDRELPDEDRQRIKDIVQAHPAVIGLHDLRTRASGRDTFIQIHLELDGEMTLLRSHEIADEVEARIRT